MGRAEGSLFLDTRSLIESNAQPMLLGGHSRVGLEDDIYFDKGRLAKSNAQLVERPARIARELGREPVSPGEARQILQLGAQARQSFGGSNHVQQA